LLWITAVTLVAAIGPVAAQISGTYAFSGTGSCVIASAGFNSAFQPVNPPVFYDSFSVAGFRTFNSNGTGSVQAIVRSSTSPVPPGSFAASSSSASASDVTYEFTYTITPPGIISLHLVPGTYLQTFSTGPRAGQTASLNLLNAYAVLSGDAKQYMTITKTTEVETKSYSNSDVLPQVCHRSTIGIHL